MSDGQFYRWATNGVMGRRGTLSLLVGIALGWTGATLVDEDDSSSAAGAGTERDPGAASTGGPGTLTDSPPNESTVTATAEPTPTSTATPEPTQTGESTATEQPATTTPPGERLGSNLDVSSRGFGDNTSYQVIYSIHNRNDVTVVVEFEATVSLSNGESLRQEATATIDPGQAATDEFVFEGYDASPSGWDFRVRAVRRE